MKNILNLFLFSVIIFFQSQSVLADPRNKIYTVAVVPQFSSTQVYREWTPFLSHLEKSTGIKFELKVYDNFQIFEADFAQGIPDLVYLNPYHMVVAHQKQHYRPLLRDNSNLSGIVVVRQDSPIQNIADLQDKIVAFPSPNALGASLYIRALFAEKERIKINPVYVNGHQNVYRQVILGDAAAGGGIKKTLSKEPEAVQTLLRVIFSTPEIVSHPLAAHPRVPAKVSQKIVTAILAMSNNPETGNLLAALQLPQPVAANFKHDYASLINLKLDRYALVETK